MRRVSVKELPDFLLSSIKRQQKFTKREIGVDVKDSYTVGANMHAPQYDNFDYSYYMLVNVKSRSVDFPQSGLKQPSPGNPGTEKSGTLRDDEFLVYGDKHSNYASIDCNSDTFNKYFGDLKTVSQMLKGAALELIRLMERKASGNHLTPADASKLQNFFEMEARSPSIKNKVTEDRGTCVLGNGISVEVAPSPRHRNTRKTIVFRNIWTQAEQPKAIEAMIENAEKKFPEYKGKIRYECGNMD